MSTIEATTAPADSQTNTSDPLLTSLCAICHIEPPRYRCPRCELRTCSLGCTRRHKAWSSCSGIRDATAYVAPSKLKTPAGVDHDFNFLSGIERAVRNSEREIIEERGLMSTADLRPIEVRSVQWRRGKDGTRRKVMVTEVLRGGSGGNGARHGGGSGPGGRPEMSRQMKKRLATLNIFVRHLPVGMARQKENSTTTAKASGRMNWQVEWLSIEEDQQGGNGGDEKRTPKTTRILGKALDHLPLCVAFSNSRSAHLASADAKDHKGDQEREQQDAGEGHGPSHRQQHQGKSKKRGKQALPTPEVQDPDTATWPLGDYSLQPYPTPSWKRYSGTAAFTGPTEEELAQRARYAFYLCPHPSSRVPEDKTTLHPIDPMTSLSEALRDTIVLEFPTIFVVPAAVATASSTASLHQLLPPDEYLIKSKPASRANTANAGTNNAKRKRQDPPHRAGTNPPHKKHRRDFEEGEVASDQEGAVTPRGGNSDDGGDDMARYEIVAEESLGEDDDKDDQDDTTSSSGSDSEGEHEGNGSSVKASLARKLAILRKT